MTDTDVTRGVLEQIKDVVGQVGAGRVFGTPIEQDGVIVLPVAKISAGGGAGGGTGPVREGSPEGSGRGGGFGLGARPAGVFVIRGGHVSWRPALDINMIVLGGQTVAIVALLVARSVLKAYRSGGRGHQPR